MSGYSSVNGKNLQNHSLTSVNKMQNNPFLANTNGSGCNNGYQPMSSTSPSQTNTTSIMTTIAGSPGRARDRNVFMQPLNSAPIQLSLLKGYFVFRKVSLVFFCFTLFLARYC